MSIKFANLHPQASADGQMHRPWLLLCLTASGEYSGQHHSPASSLGLAQFDMH